MFLSLLLLPLSAAAATPYLPRGIGGGGAMASYSISPYANLRFVGTDMGTLFRSTDGGRHWQGIDQREARFSSDLPHAAELGFSADGHTVFHAAGGLEPQRSTDSGVKWKSITMPLQKDERIRYWVSDPKEASFLLCATTAGLLVTHDKGTSWNRIDGVSGEAEGTFLYHPDPRTRVILHATPDQIWRSAKGSQRFEPWYSPSGFLIRGFAGGADSSGVTLALIDNRGHEACSWAGGDAGTEKTCGFVWIARQESKNEPAFERTKKEAGDFVRMASNDSRTIYVTGGNWVRGYGSKVWVSRDRGASWELKLHLYDWDKHPYAPWPSDKLEYSAVGLDVGWDDNEYYGFTVNALSSAEAGGTGNYFLHTTRDYGSTWQSPFTIYADVGPRQKGRFWRSNGLEVTSVLKLKFHPKNPKLGYAAMADLGGIITEDGGDTWRISKAQYNTNYDYAFDPAQPDWVYAASGATHDFPIGQRAPMQGEGGIYLSKDRGRTWTRLTPKTGLWNRQFLSVAYDAAHHTLYGGTQGAGIVRSTDEGRDWRAVSDGLPTGPVIVPQLEVDPANGSVYALVTGSSANGIYRLKAGASGWEPLRGDVVRPAGVDAKYALLSFPTAFAVDFTRPNRDVLWLADYEQPGAWLSTGIWKSMDGGQSWKRMTQFTHPTSLTLDPSRHRIYATGPFDPSWGQGGALYSDNGGASWKKNEKLPYSRTPDGVTLDPNDRTRLFYLFFGTGMLYGVVP